jgi:hypothetical protein
LFTIAGGDFGSRQTLAKMRTLVNAALAQPLVVNTAKEIVKLCPPGAFECQALAIGRWLADHFLFIRDPLGVELLHEPRYMLQVIDTRAFFQGDCDDAAVLGAALAKAVGLRARFRAIGFRRGGLLSHVIADVRTPSGWVQYDVTRPAQFTRLPQVARSLIVEV